MARLMDSERVEITSPYGYRISPTTGQRKKHEGIDLVGRPRTGTNPWIKAHTGGVVKTATYSSSWGYYVDIQVDANTFMRYAHMQRNLKVKTGQTIPDGTIIGQMGNTGSSAGTHLHWGIYVNGNTIDPEPYLEEDYLEMTQDQFNEMLLKGLEFLAQRNPSTYAEAVVARDVAIDNSLFKGDENGNYNWRGLITREEAAILFHRYGLK